MKVKILKALTAVVLFLLPLVGSAQAPTLGTTANFVLFTTVGAVTNSGTGHLTHLTGNVGSNSGSITGFGNIDGKMLDGGVASAACAVDLLALYAELDGATPTAVHAVALGVGETILPGVYSIPAAATLNGHLNLDAGGDPNAVFIFQIEGPLSGGAFTKINLINGALACNVFWKVEGLISIATGATLRGTFVAHNFAINLGVNDTLEGRAFAIIGEITTNALMAYTPIGCGSPFLTGPAAPALVSTAAFGVFSSIGDVTSTPITYVTGDVGSNSAAPTGFDPGNVTGTIHPAPNAITAAAAGDLTNVYIYLNLLTTDVELLYPAQFGFDHVLTPHTYNLAGAPTTLTGNIYLNAQGNPDAVFVIKMAGAYITSIGSKVILMNGAQAKNVYWKISGAVNINTNSVFNGNIIGAGAININTGDTLNGRAHTINGAIAINGSYVTITPAACVASAIMGTTDVCTGAITTLSATDTGGRWTSSDVSVATIDSISGIVSGISAGTTFITFTSGLACQSTDTVTVNPSPSAITGTDSVCVGSSTILTNSMGGGSWTSSNVLVATVGTAGNVAGVSAGIVQITYTMVSGGGCFVTRSVTVNQLPNAGVITGTATVCPTATTTLSNVATGGVWSSVTTATATIGSSTGIVTGVAVGTTTISYTVTTGCGTSAATTVVTVNASPNAGTITGTATVCTTDNTTLSNTAGSGVWSSVNTAVATIGSASGIVSGIIAGTSTISYIVTNGCGTVAATTVVTVTATPNSGTITGTGTVCPSATTTLSNVASGGVWSSVTTATATIGSSTGIVTGVAAGTTTISYTVTTGCGTVAATTVVTVNASPSVGTITGTGTVCAGGNTTFSNAASGGTWSSVNTAVATIGSASGIATGVLAGTSTISYTITNGCGTVAATTVITVNPLPVAGTITGTGTVCPAATTTLSSTAAGGVWTSVTMTTAIIGSASGIVTGITAGTTTISYAVTNGCGTAVATTVVTVNASPNAGSLSGPSSVCVGSAISLTETVSGGVWSASNTNATVSFTGTVTGVTAGSVAISYTVISICGTATATHTVIVNPMPNAGSISGLSSVCVTSVITLTNVVTGGTWSSSNATATVGSATGVVTGVAAGIDTVTYTFNNVCGTATTTKIVTVNALPDAGSITGLSSVCVAANIALSNTATGGIWTSSNSNASVSSTGNVTGVTTGTVVISYTVSNVCGTDHATKILTVNPLPNAGTITGTSGVCLGSTITLANTTTGGVWSSSNANVTVIAGAVTGISVGTANITYAVTNMCGIATSIKVVSVNALPLVPVISIQSPASVCTGTMYQNFGTTTTLPAGTVYNWTAANSIMWAQGTANMNSVINFTTPGIAIVTLHATILATGCTSNNAVLVTVGPAVAHIDEVSYFAKHFVCTPNTDNSYQWGYDNAATLDSTILVGEINQDYVNATPDFANKLYWVMTTNGGCQQKTYYKAPLTVQNVQDETATANVYPNPATSVLNVTLISTVQGAVVVEVWNMMGQRVNTATAIDHKSTIDVSMLPGGTYVVTCSIDGVKLTSTRFIKN